MIGETLGSYRVLAKLGEGGMGAVFTAEHTLLGRKVALKVLLPEHSKNEELVTRFFTEAKTVANLRHPAIVEVFDYGVHANGSAYLVMELLSGESLAKRLERGPLAPVAAAEIARLIANGVGAAHASGIVHRDLKPDNVFLVPDPEDATRERVKILDFGIAKLLTPEAGSSKATRTGAVLGTPWFMSPEQCKGAGAVDHRADIYSLGCILYAMLVGTPPFAFEGIGEIIGAHLYEAPKPLREIDVNIPAALEAVVLKMLAKKPEDRQVDMLQVAQELAAAAGLRVTVPAPASRAAVGVAKTAALTDPAPREALARTAAPTTLGSSARQQSDPQPAARSSKVPLIAAGTGVAIMAVVAGLWMRGGSTQGKAPAAQAVVAPAAAPPPAVPPAVVPPEPPAAVAPAPAVAVAPPPAPVAPAPTVKKKSPPVESAIARAMALRERGEDGEALAAFRAILAAGVLPAQRAQVERQVIELQRQLSEVEVLCDLAGAAVTLDGRKVGTTPLGRSLIVRPGPHQLTVAMPGYDTIVRSITLAPGERKPFVFKRPR